MKYVGRGVNDQWSSDGFYFNLEANLFIASSQLDENEQSYGWISIPLALASRDEHEG